MDIQQQLGLIVFGVFAIGISVEWLGGRLRCSPRPGRDLLFCAFGILSQGIVSGAILGTLAGALVATLWPTQAGTLSGTPFWLAFPLIFFTEEFLHYWIHRYAHEWRWLWKLHRTHHSAQHLNLSTLYRFNLFWVFLLPQSWMGAFCFYLGLGEPFAAAVLVTYLVNVLTHTSFRWDIWLRERSPWAAPLWCLIERTITLPDTHHAHHAYGKSAHPNGNYAVTVFLYDVLFGTAKIPRQRQQHYGLPISARLHWAEELFWPMVRKPLLPKAELSKQELS